MRTTLLLLLLISASLAPHGAAAVEKEKALRSAASTAQGGAVTAQSAAVTAQSAAVTAQSAVPPALNYSQSRTFRELLALPRHADAAAEVSAESDAYAEALAQPLRPASTPEARTEAKFAAARIGPLGELGQPPGWAMLLAGGAVAVFLARRVTGGSA